ncbi:MAG: hypothetical protein WCA35_22295, partial [Kovacikia sp.]
LTGLNIKFQFKKQLRQMKTGCRGLPPSPVYNPYSLNGDNPLAGLIHQTTALARNLHKLLSDMDERL